MLGRLRSLFAPPDGEEAFTALIASRGRELEERSAQLRTAVVDLERRRERAQELHARVEHILRDGAAELDVRQAELDVRATALTVREEALARAEAHIDDRRRELGAVELHRAALERREEALRRRELELEERAVELAALARRLDEVGAIISCRAQPVRDDEHVAITADSEYRIVARPGPAPAPGEAVDLEDGPHVCVRVTRSPYPLDTRRCALLERVDDAPPA